jgi:hypothetical protein
MGDPGFFCEHFLEYRDGSTSEWWGSRGEGWCVNVEPGRSFKGSCLFCGGSGKAATWDDPAPITCPMCKGSGKIRYGRQHANYQRNP